MAEERQPPPAASLAESARTASFGGRTIATLESRHAAEMAELIRRYGGVPWSVPALREMPPDDRSESVQRLKQLCDAGTDVFICLTGVGTRAIFELAAELGLEGQLRSALDRALVVIRGPKPRAVLRDLGVRIDRVADEPNTSREVLEALADDSFRTAAIQLYGAPDELLRTGLEARGATVLELPLYRWSLPDDVTGLLDLIDRLEAADALAVTSASQVRNLLTVAEANDRRSTLLAKLSNVKLAAVGPVAAKALEEHGLSVSVIPAHSSMGALVRDLARFFLAGDQPGSH